MDANSSESSSACLSSELVWDSGRCATAISGGAVLTEGPDAEWSPALLLATAAGASILSTFIDLARRVHLPVMGLATQQRVQADANDRVTGVMITASITVPSKAAEADARTVWMRAIREARVLQALACRVTAEPRIVVVSDDAGARAGVA